MCKRGTAENTVHSCPYASVCVCVCARGRERGCVCVRVWKSVSKLVSKRATKLCLP